MKHIEEDIENKIVKVLRLFRDGNGRTKQEIVNEIGNFGTNHSKDKRVNRIKKSINDNFGIEIKHNRGTGKYHVIEGINDIDELIKVIENAIVVDSIVNSFKHFNTYKDIIQYDKSTRLSSTRSFDKILNAIKITRIINFRYKKFNGVEKVVKVSPYFLKESAYRWYLIGLNNNSEKRTYNLDRIVGDIEISEDSFEINEDKINCSEEFADMIGISKTDPRADNVSFKKKEIVFQVGEKIRNLIEEQPIHNSQETIEETDEYTTYKVYLRDNYEFLNKLYSYIPFVKILSPEYFKEKFYSELKQTLDLK